MEVGPLRSFKEWADGGERVVAEFHDEEAARFQMASGLRDQ